MNLPKLCAVILCLLLSQQGLSPLYGLSNNHPFVYNDSHFRATKTNHQNCTAGYNKYMHEIGNRDTETAVFAGMAGFAAGVALAPMCGFFAPFICGTASYLLAKLIIAGWRSLTAKSHQNKTNCRKRYSKTEVNIGSTPKTQTAVRAAEHSAVELKIKRRILIRKLQTTLANGQTDIGTLKILQSQISIVDRQLSFVGHR